MRSSLNHTYKQFLDSNTSLLSFFFGPLRIEKSLNTLQGGYRGQSPTSAQNRVFVENYDDASNEDDVKPIICFPPSRSAQWALLTAQQPLCHPSPSLSIASHSVPTTHTRVYTLLLLSPMHYPSTHLSLPYPPQNPSFLRCTCIVTKIPSFSSIWKTGSSKTEVCWTLFKRFSWKYHS